MNKLHLLKFRNDFHIDYNESTSIKGLLMILIILGHNYMLSNHSCDNMIFFWLYYFHVSMFFVLPLYYNNKSNTLKGIIVKNIRRLYVPYIWFYVLSTILYSLLYGIELNFINFLKGMIPLNSLDISNVAGVKFLWFVPVFFLFNIIVSLFKQSNYNIKLVILILSILGYFIKIIFNVSFIPIIALYYFALSYLIYIIYNNSYRSIQLVSTSIFVILSFLFFLKVDLGYLVYFFPIFFWGCLLLLKGLIKNSKVLYCIGKYSFPIYMIHFFINSVFERILEFNFINGLLSFIATITISYYTVYWISRYPIYNKIFPK